MRLKKELGFLLLSAPPGGIGLASGAESAIFESYSTANQRRSFFFYYSYFSCGGSDEKKRKSGPRSLISRASSVVICKLGCFGARRNNVEFTYRSAPEEK